jgi:sugar/nucleoside kinase (ribokinase family)
MFSDHGSFAAPAYPLEEVFDPTGAGDTFAGGFMGYLASQPQHDEESLRRAVIMGSALASYCVEAFSLDRLLKLTRMEIDERFRLFKRLTHFENI